jgi:hypothetical protein
MKRYQITNGVLSRLTNSGTRTFGFPGCTPVISAVGTNNGIVWSTAIGNPAILTAYNATNIVGVGNAAAEIYNSAQAGTRDSMANGVKFAQPMVANGKVYAGAQFAVTVFGLRDPTLNWKSFHFGSNATNNSVAGDFADPDGDGLVNLFEYALGTDPATADPRSSLSADVLAGHARVFFNRNASATDLTFVLETSSDFATWSPALTYAPGTGWTSAGTATATETPPSSLPPDQTVAVTADMGAPSATSQFVRLKVHR